MNKKFFCILLLIISLFFMEDSVDAEPLLSNPYIIATDENNEVSKEVPKNLVHLQYIGENIKDDLVLNGKKLNSFSFISKKNDVLIIKNMGIYKKEPIDLRIRIIDIEGYNISIPNVTIYPNGEVKIYTGLSQEVTNIFDLSVYKHNTTTIYPNLYVGYSDNIKSGWGNYITGDTFGVKNIYGLYLPKDISNLQNADVIQTDGNLNIRYDIGSVNEVIYPIFNNSSSGFSRGLYYSKGIRGYYFSLFNPTYPSPIPIPYDEVIGLTNEQETTDIHSLDVKYAVNQKLANYSAPWQYPSDNTFKIKTDFERTNLEDFPVDVVVRLADDQVVDEKYYRSTFIKNSHEVTFSTDFLQEYKGSTIQIEYSQHLDGEKFHLLDYYNLEEKVFFFPYSSENSWERQGDIFNQQNLTTGQTKVKFGIELGGTAQNGKKVIQNKNTDDYSPLDFISDLTSNIPNDTVTASFTKKVIFENRGEQEVFITLKSTLSSVTKDIVLKVVVLEGSLHFTDVPSGVSFPSVKLTGKLEDYEVSSFNQGILSVLDERLTKSPWGLTATLTGNKTDNDFGDILYFRNEEGQVYNITNQAQNIVTNKNLDSSKTIIDYTKNKNIGLFMRINPLFVKKGGYDGIITWSLVDAPG